MPGPAPGPDVGVVDTLLAFKGAFTNFDAVASDEQWLGWTVTAATGTSDICSWTGVSCSEGQVIGLSFSNASLEGALKCAGRLGWPSGLAQAWIMEHQIGYAQLYAELCMWMARLPVHCYR